MAEAVIFIGIQACGKTTYYHRFLESYQHINLDELHTRNKERLLLEKCIDEGLSFVADNTNPTRYDREKYILAAKKAGFKVVGYYFRSSIGESIERNAARSGRTNVPKTAIMHTHAILELPSYDEGFDELYYVRIESGEFITEKWEV